ncbi:myozenin-2-like [Gadus macrocephalus]|uniref:myozenin-2-like n=1 Tax=Gadus macrocephalus TaxID=80720 RepID=UPI0028CB4766|nr:myozenin-2-like [Gadus macrocephalus]
MSQFSSMTTNERKMQAAAISREIYGGEDVEIDLGKKMCVPKDIMLDELSVASNRGSRLFKMRQKRSEKYTYESIQNPPAAPLDGIVLESQNGDTTEGQNGSSDPAPETGPETAEPNPESIAPGYGGPLKDVPAEKFNITSVPKSYHSPWEQALTSDPALAETLLAALPEPVAQPLPGYKSFNRVATPFRGFGGPPRSIPTADQEPLPDLPDLSAAAAAAAARPCRPTFNRHAAGWVPVGPPPTLPKVSLQPMLIPESDDL